MLSYDQITQAIDLRREELNQNKDKKPSGYLDLADTNDKIDEIAKTQEILLKALQYIIKI